MIIYYHKANSVPNSQNKNIQDNDSYIEKNIVNVDSMISQKISNDENIDNIENIEDYSTLPEEILTSSSNINNNCSFVSNLSLSLIDNFNSSIDNSFNLKIEEKKNKIESFDKNEEKKNEYINKIINEKLQKFLDNSIPLNVIKNLIKYCKEKKYLDNFFAIFFDNLIKIFQNFNGMEIFNYYFKYLTEEQKNILINFILYNSIELILNKNSYKIIIKIIKLKQKIYNDFYVNLILKNFEIYSKNMYSNNIVKTIYKYSDNINIKKLNNKIFNIKDCIDNDLIKIAYSVSDKEDKKLFEEKFNITNII